MHALPLVLGGLFALQSVDLPVEPAGQPADLPVEPSGDAPASDLPPTWGPGTWDLVPDEAFPATAVKPNTGPALHLEHHDVRTNSIRLHVVMAGPVDGPLVIMLHGFPEFWYAWRKQMLFLASKGYRVWAPDMRGYNTSTRPFGVQPYSVNNLVEDVIGLIEASGRVQSIVVGHDWGGLVAWHLARIAPDRVTRLVIMNAPHPYVAEHAVARHPTQLLRSWYIPAFLMPVVPEFILGMNRAWFIGMGMRWATRDGAVDQDDIEKYRQAWTIDDEVLTSGLNYYRAMAWYPPPDSPIVLPMPTLIIWGENDLALIPDLATQSVQLCAKGKLLMIPGAGHFVQQDAADQVNTALHDFFQKPDEE